MRAPSKIVFVISSLGMGGAQRALSTLASGFCARGWDVTILTFDAPGVPSFFNLPHGVCVQHLALSAISTSFHRGLARNIERVRALRQAIKELRPEVAVGFMDATNVVTILAAMGTGTPVIACERTNPTESGITPLWRLLRKLSYPLASHVVAQTEAVRRLLPGRSHVIPNPVLLPKPPKTAQPGMPRPAIIGMGRLSTEKGFDVLMRAFARIAPRHPKWTLRIVGDGPEKESLTRLIGELGLTDRIILVGSTTDPDGALREADIFALTSRYEGFPNALCEALACGVPAVAFDCPSGPAEILCNGVDGILVPAGDEDGFAKALDRVMSDESLRRVMAEQAPHIIERFSLGSVLDKWEELFLAAANPTPAKLRKK